MLQIAINTTPGRKLTGYERQSNLRARSRRLPQLQPELLHTTEVLRCNSCRR